MKGYFITGTDTGVGKTRVACGFLRALAASGRRGAGFKPICCGGREDARALLEACGSPSGMDLDAVNPVWFKTPAAPFTAAAVENREFDLKPIFDGFCRLKEKHESVIVEGIGGWRVPIRKDYFLGDLAVDLGLPVIVVTRPNLGTINHTLLTVEAIWRDGLDLAGLVLNQPTPEVDAVSAGTNPSILKELTGLPILARIGYGEQPDFSRLVAKLFE